MRDDISIRPLASQSDYQACVELQRDTWGQRFSDAVPGSILLIAQRLGGVAAGAFDARERLIGFVFGVTGVENGSIVHWSDMLAVRAEARDRGVGRRLKQFQRETVARVGARVIYWTYDPLVARNAHLNFNVFGVRVVEYVRDMYGEGTGSDLHRGIGTDRLIVAWPVDDAELALRKQEIAAALESPDHKSDDCLRIEIPRDIAVFQSSDPARAGKCRASTRAAFESALESGYRVDGFAMDGEQDRGFYLLTRSRKA